MIILGVVTGFKKNTLLTHLYLNNPLQDEDFIARESFDDTDQLRVGNDGIFMLTFFSKSAQYSL